MNRSFRSVWNHALGAWVAVSEITAARGKRSGGLTTTLVLAGLGTLAASSSAQIVNYTGGATAPYPDYLGPLTALAAPATTLTLNSLDSLTATQSGTIGGLGGITKTGAGTIALTGVNSYQGGTTINGGALRVSNDNQLGAANARIVLDNGTLQMGGNGFTSARAIQLGAGGGTIDANDTRSNVLTGRISGAGRLSLVNSGSSSAEDRRFSIDNASSNYSGGTTIGFASVTVDPITHVAPRRINVTTSTTGSLGSGRIDILGNAELQFLGASAGATDITVHQSTNILGSNSGLQFDNAGASAGTSTLTLDAPGAYVFFSNGATAANATIKSNGGRLYFYGSSSGGSATVINNGGLLYLQDVTDLSGATVQNNTGGQLFVNGVATSVSVGSLSGQGNVTLGAKNLTVGALGRDDALGGIISDQGPANLDAVLVPYNGAVTATGGSLTKIGAGTLTLSGANTYSGTTRVDAGTLKAGAANTLSAASAHTVAAGATLDLAGFSQSVASLTNGGTVSLAGAAAGTTLRVTGPYVGNNGTLHLGTTLNASGPSDRLVLDGAAAIASGKTTVQITNLNGLGGQTAGNGIEVISALNGATTTAQTTRDAFALGGGHVDAGAFEYRLYAADASGAGENWYLRSQAAPTPPAPVIPAPSVLPPAPAPAPAPAYRVEVPLIAAVPAQLRQNDLAMLGNLHRRTGDDDASAQSLAALTPVAGALATDRHAWARAIYTDLDVRQEGTVNPSSQGHASGVQAGTDLYVSPLGDWRAGVYIGVLDGNADVSGSASGLWRAVGSNDLRSRYLAAYASYANTTGFYVDTVLQYGSQRYTVKPIGRLETSGDGSSWLAAVEVGQAFAMGGGWTVEPQAQLIYSRARLDDLTIPGARVQQDNLDSWTAGLGVRVKGDFATSAGRLQPYGRVGVIHGTGGDTIARFIGPAAFADIATAGSYTSIELAGGLTLALNRSTSLYGEVGHLFSTGGNTEVKASIQGAVGVRVRW